MLIFPSALGFAYDFPLNKSQNVCRTHAAQGSWFIPIGFDAPFMEIRYRVTKEISFRQVLVQFLRQSDEVLFWINDKEAFVTAEEFGHDLEHVEVLQRKFDEFQKDMATQVSILLYVFLSPVQ